MIAFRSIRKKILISFFVLMSLGVAAFFYSYLGVLNASETLSNAPASTHKLTLINQTLVKIYESESNARLYSATNDEAYLKEYIRQNGIIDSSLQVLRNISYNSEQQLQLVNILVLQSQKSKLIKELIDLKKLKIHPGDYSKVFKNRKSDSIEVEMKQKVFSSANAMSATEAPAKKRSFFARLKALFKDDETKKVDAQIKHGLQSKVDSVSFTQKTKDKGVADIRRQVERLRANEEMQSKELAAREVDLLKRDKLLTDRMLFQITKLSHEEVLMNRKQLEKFDEASSEYTQRILLLGISSVFIIAIFLFLIIRDVKINTEMQKQLEDSNDKIQELLKVKERFLANMSHEIRTPLSAIVGFSELLLKKRAFSDEEVLAINTSAKHLHAIVNEILDYSKVESNNIELEITVFSPEELAKEVISEMSIKAKEKTIDLFLNIADIPIAIKADRMRLKQVLLNLVSNAIKFTDQGEVIVNIFEQDDQLKFEVVDTGIGIPEGAQTKIFDEFTQADGTVARKFGGTGLGLSISRKLVLLMGGDLRLVSKEGLGSTFSISFPLDVVESDEAIASPLPTLSSQSVPSRVLFIDDDAFVRLLISKILTANSISFDEAHNGIEGTEKSRKGIYNLIITDLHMPGMSGIDTVKAIKEFNPNAKVLFLSADMSDSMQSEMRSVGANGILQKPFSEVELLTAITNILNPSSGETPKGTPVAGADALCDLSKVAAFVGDNHDELKLIISTFVSSADDAISFINDNNLEGNEKMIADQAHKLLTGFRQFEIAKGVEYLRSIEKCRNGVSLSEVQDDILELQKLWLNVRKSLQRSVS